MKYRDVGEISGRCFFSEVTFYARLSSGTQELKIFVYVALESDFGKYVNTYKMCSVDDEAKHHPPATVLFNSHASLHLRSPHCASCRTVRSSVPP